MEFQDAWKQAYKILKENGIDEPSDVDYIFCEVLKKNRAELKLLKEINNDEYSKIIDFVNLRATHLPLQRIFGKADFFGLQFYVDESTLIPRFDTEILVEQVIKFIKKQTKKLKILDLCTGSGCIAISIAKYCDVEILATDINQNALNLAQKNAKYNNVKVNFMQSNMFDNISKMQKFDIIISNPPYIETNIIPTLDKSVKEFDPIIALDGGLDGLDFYRIIASNAKDYLNNNGKIFIEIGKNQAKSVANLLKVCYNNIEIVKDLQNNERVITAEFSK